MISRKERDSIIDRIQIENEIRSRLSMHEPIKKPKRWAWLESNLALLVVGAVLSGILIPTFQLSQEMIKWSRQNRYDNLKSRIDSARSALRELTMTHVFVAEAYERMRVAIESFPATPEMLKDYKRQSLDLQNRRFLQNAKLVGALEMLDEPTRGVAHNAFNTYISSVQQLVHITNVLPETTAASRSVPEKGNVELLRRSLASLSEDVNKNYSRVMQILNMYLRHLEVQSESYF